MTAKRLYEVLGKLILDDPSVADLEVCTGPENAAGGSCSAARYVIDRAPQPSNRGVRDLLIVAQPNDWRFGRPDSPAALSSDTDKELLVALISELGNTLVPALHWLEKIKDASPEAARAYDAIERAANYTQIIKRKAGGV